MSRVDLPVLDTDIARERRLRLIADEALDSADAARESLERLRRRLVREEGVLARLDDDAATVPS